MKKIALALMCCVSVAFLASCTKETPNPTISVATQEGFIQNNDVVDVPSTCVFGFNVAAELNGKDLTKLYVTVSDGDTTMTWADLDLTALAATRSYAYVDTLELRRDIIGHVNINAVVTDAAGKTATASIGFDVNEPAIPLEVSDFEWTKIGHSVMDLTSYGLKWHENNWKSPYTHIYAADGYKLYVRNGDDFATITNSIELANYYNAILEQGIPSDEQYNRVDCNASADYNDMLVTVNEATGEIQLIHVTRAEITTPSQGTKVVISGQCK